MEALYTLREGKASLVLLPPPRGGTGRNTSLGLLSSKMGMVPYFTGSTQMRFYYQASTLLIVLENHCHHH